MSRFLLGLVVGSVGTAACMYGILSLLPATRETPEREPLVGPRDPRNYYPYRGGVDREHTRADLINPDELWGTSGDGHVRWTPLT